jgi:hypothetical protein
MLQSNPLLELASSESRLSVPKQPGQFAAGCWLVVDSGDDHDMY